MLMNMGIVCQMFYYSSLMMKGAKGCVTVLPSCALPASCSVFFQDVLLYDALKDQFTFADGPGFLWLSGYPPRNEPVCGFTDTENKCISRGMNCLAHLVTSVENISEFAGNETILISMITVLVVIVLIASVASIILYHR